jgi:hypothetical protein
MLDRKNSFKEKLYECDKHVEKITIAKKYISPLMPLNVESHEVLDDIQISFIDQLIFRFSKLQDTIGEKLFPNLLVLSSEDIKRKTFIDILNRLEELEIVDKNRWQYIREIRNQIAHEYSFNKDELIASINGIYSTSDELIEIYNNVKSFANSRLDI